MIGNILQRKRELVQTSGFFSNEKTIQEKCQGVNAAIFPRPPWDAVQQPDTRCLSRVSHNPAPRLGVSHSPVAGQA